MLCAAALESLETHLPGQEIRVSRVKLLAQILSSGLPANDWGERPS